MSVRAWLMVVLLLGWCTVGLLVAFLVNAPIGSLVIAAGMPLGAAARRERRRGRPVLQHPTHRIRRYSFRSTGVPEERRDPTTSP